MDEFGKYRKTLSQIGRLEAHDAIREQAMQLERSEHLDVLREWQTQRLKLTYQDFLRSSRYGPACRFFLDDIYAAKDFRQRDHEIKHLYEIMSHFLPDFLLRLVTRTIELYDLTNALDEALLSSLRQDQSVADTITPDLYAEAYRICDNYADRAHQIELIGEVGHMVEIGTKIPLVGTSLKLARLPAQATGWIDLHDFIQRGFHSFKRMRGSEKFLQAINDREMRILDRIYAEHPQPFEPYLSISYPSQ
jgi:hypothetical protein